MVQTNKEFYIVVHWEGKNTYSTIEERMCNNLSNAVIIWSNLLRKWGSVPGCYGTMYRDKEAIEAFDNRKG